MTYIEPLLSLGHNMLKRFMYVNLKSDQSGTKPKLVAFLMATNFGHFLLFLLPKLVVF